MNRCPHCQATANSLRLVCGHPYSCPQCGGHSVNAEPRTESLAAVAFVLAAVSVGLIAGACGLLDGTGGLRGSSIRVAGLIASLIGLIGLRFGWLMLLLWLLGRLSPLPSPDLGSVVGPGNSGTTKDTPEIPETKQSKVASGVVWFCMILGVCLQAKTPDVFNHLSGSQEKILYWLAMLFGGLGLVAELAKPWSLDLRKTARLWFGIAWWSCFGILLLIFTLPQVFQDWFSFHAVILLGAVLFFEAQFVVRRVRQFVEELRRRRFDLLQV